MNLPGSAMPCCGIAHWQNQCHNIDYKKGYIIDLMNLPGSAMPCCGIDHWQNQCHNLIDYKKAMSRISHQPHLQIYNKVEGFAIFKNSNYAADQGLFFMSPIPKNW